MTKINKKQLISDLEQLEFNAGLDPFLIDGEEFEGFSGDDEFLLFVDSNDDALEIDIDAIKSFTSVFELNRSEVVIVLKNGLTHKIEANY